MAGRDWTFVPSWNFKHVRDVSVIRTHGFTELKIWLWNSNISYWKRAFCVATMQFMKAQRNWKNGCYFMPITDAFWSSLKRANDTTTIIHDCMAFQYRSLDFLMGWNAQTEISQIGVLKIKSSSKLWLKGQIAVKLLCPAWYLRALVQSTVISGTWRPLKKAMHLVSYFFEVWVGVFGLWVFFD